MKKVPFVFFILTLLLVACSSIDCPIATTVAVNYTFCDAAGAKTTLDDTLSVWTRRGDGTDTLLFNRGVGQTALQLPISYQRPEDILVFRIADVLNVETLDTVWITKEDIPHFESVDCAAHFFHTLTAVRSTHRGIDTIAIINPSVTYDTSVEHLRICFKARR
ncbi:MAG: alpha amylase [Prevotella sp.]|nr:alpha amylase [Prevotella sp.]